MLLKRRGMTAEEADEKSKKAAVFLLRSELYKNARQIMLYKALGKETDTALIIEDAHAKGKGVVLPVTDKETGRMTPYLVTPRTVYEKGAFSIEEPQNCKVADMSLTDLIVVPGVAFDKTGRRIGFGKGCYDMFLENVKKPKIGLCYEFQLMEEIPGEEHDIKMDYIITEKGMTLCKKV